MSFRGFPFGQLHLFGVHMYNLKGQVSPIGSMGLSIFTYTDMYNLTKNHITYIYTSYV